MEGRTRRAGAVGALSGFLHPISVARQVLEQLPHVMLVGAGAARFAAEIGAEAGEPLTDEAARVWRAGLEGKIDGLDLTQRGMGLQQSLREAVRLAIDPEHAGGTVNVLAHDTHGDIAVAVSTSGTAWKYPGRLGDSPVIGAGGYADNRFGAAACTGLGELAIRAGAARSVVAALARGDSIEAACAAALRDVIALGGDGEYNTINIVALDASGRPYGASTRAGRTIIYQTHDMEAPAEMVSDHVQA